MQTWMLCLYLCLYLYLCVCVFYSEWLSKCFLWFDECLMCDIKTGCAFSLAAYGGVAVSASAPSMGVCVCVRVCGLPAIWLRCIDTAHLSIFSGLVYTSIPLECRLTAVAIVLLLLLLLLLVLLLLSLLCKQVTSGRALHLSYAIDWGQSIHFWVAASVKVICFCLFASSCDNWRGCNSSCISIFICGCKSIDNHSHSCRYSCI